MPRILANYRPILLIFFIFITSFYSLLLGQDTNWDQLNYHYYGVYAFLHSRFRIDAGPAGIETYLNPRYLHPVLRHGIRTLPPFMVGLAMGAIHGLNFWLVLIIAEQITRSLPPNRADMGRCDRDWASRSPAHRCFPEIGTSARRHSHQHSHTRRNFYHHAARRRRYPGETHLAFACGGFPFGCRDKPEIDQCGLRNRFGRSMPHRMAKPEPELTSFCIDGRRGKHRVRFGWRLLVFPALEIFQKSYLPVLQ